MTMSKEEKEAFTNMAKAHNEKLDKEIKEKAEAKTEEAKEEL